jgi:hypothetical protein
MDLPRYCIEKYPRFNDMSAIDGTDVGTDAGTDVGTMQNADSDSDKEILEDSKPSKPAAITNGTFGKRPNGRNKLKGSKWAQTQREKLIGGSSDNGPSPSDDVDDAEDTIGKAFSSISTVMEQFAANQQARQNQEHTMNLLAEVNKTLQLVNNSPEIQQMSAPIIGGIFNQLQHHLAQSGAVPGAYPQAFGRTVTPYPQTVQTFPQTAQVQVQPQPLAAAMLPLPPLEMLAQVTQAQEDETEYQIQKDD